MTVEEWKVFSGDENFDLEVELLRKPNQSPDFNPDYRLC